MNRKISVFLGVCLLVACSTDRSTAPTGVDVLARDNLISPVASNSNGSWATRAQMPTQRYNVAVGVVNGLLYAVGGIATLPNVNGTGFISVPTATVEVYNPTTNTWTTKTSMPTARTSLAVGVIDGTLYAVGGSNGSARMNTIEAYNPTTDTWTTKAAMPTPRANFGVGVINGILYTVGGVDNTGKYVGTVEAYNPATDTWTTKASLPTSRTQFGVGVINGVLYAAGGLRSSSVLTAVVEAYDPTADAWTTRASLSIPRAHFGAGVVNNILYAVGGTDSLGNVVETVEAYDPTTNAWTTKASMPTPRWLVGVGVVDGALYTVGGVDHTGFDVPTVEAFTPSPISTPQFKFTGFFLPLRNPPAVNRVLAGGVIPVAYSLHGNQGLDIFAQGYPQSQSQTCNGALTGIPTPTQTVGSIKLLYEKRTDLYIYAWKTDKSWSGTCRTLSLKLKDGSTHQALFLFEGRFPWPVIWQNR